MTNPTPKALAKWFLARVDREAGDAMTHLKLQKLLYFSQAWHLANFGRALFDEDMQAWAHGPVVPSVWHEYKNYGWESIPPPETKTTISGNTAAYLDAVYKHYGPYSAKTLENMTHNDEPWSKTRGSLPPEASCTSPIDKNLMRDYYAARIGKSWQ